LAPSAVSREFYTLSLHDALPISLCYDAFISNSVVAAMLKGMESGIGAVIASVVWDMAAGVVKQKSFFSGFIMIVSFLACMVWKRSEEHTSELQSRFDLVCRLLLE